MFFAGQITRLIGMPPIAYLARWRMQAAAAMLADTHVSLGHVAVEVGYESEAVFSRAFKRSTGVSPAQWRHGGQARGSA